MSILGENIKSLRERKNISKSELSRLIGVSPAYITMLENGKKDNPTNAILMKLADVFDVTLEHLLVIPYSLKGNESLYSSEIEYFGKEAINLISIELNDTEKIKFLENISKYIKNLNINNAILDSRPINKDELMYIEFITKITTMIFFLYEKYILLGCNFDEKLNFTKKENLTLNDIHDFINTYDDTLLKINKEFNKVKKEYVSKLFNHPLVKKD